MSETETKKLIPIPGGQKQSFASQSAIEHILFRKFIENTRGGLIHIRHISKVGIEIL